MNASLTSSQGVGLVVAGIVGGAALLTLFLSWISSVGESQMSSVGDGDSGVSAGCAVIGGILLVGACMIGIWVLMAA